MIAGNQGALDSVGNRGRQVWFMTLSRLFSPGAGEVGDRLMGDDAGGRSPKMWWQELNFPQGLEPEFSGLFQPCPPRGWLTSES